MDNRQKENIRVPCESLKNLISLPEHSILLHQDIEGLFVKLIADKQIPGVQALFGKYCDIKQLAGDAITRGDLAHGDILLVRSVTKVTADLLTGSAIQ